MSWQIIIYNPVTDDVVELLNLERNDGVPEWVFEKVKNTQDLDAYFHYVRTDDAVRWGYWLAKEGRWENAEHVPDQVKLVGVLAE